MIKYVAFYCKNKKSTSWTNFDVKILKSFTKKLKCQPLIEQRINNPNKYTVYHIQYGLVVQGASFRFDPGAWVRIPLLAIERLDNFDIQHCLQI